MNWPFFAAVELGFFTERRLAVEAEIFTRPPDPVAALIGGSLDLINVIPDVALLEMVQGAPLSVIANTNTRPQYRLMGRAELNDCSELRGQKVGVNDGRSAEALILRKLLKRSGLQADGYELVPSGPPLQRCERLKEGRLAATMVTEPFDFYVEEAGFKTLASSPQLVPAYPFTVAVVRRETEVNDNFVEFLRALKESWEWLADPANRRRAEALLSRATNTSEGHARKTYDLYLTPPSPPSLAPTAAGVSTMLELLADDGRIAEPPPPAESFIDERYFQAL